MRIRNFMGIAALSALPGIAQAAVIDNGTIQLGVDTRGQLNVWNDSFTDFIGVQDLRTGHESTAPGCACEGWGAGVSATDYGYANNSAGVFNVTEVSFTSTATTATSVTEVGSTLRVTHHFAPAAETDNLYRVSVSIENISGADIGDLRYTRVMDWDIEPTAFSEYVTIGGTAAASAVLYADDDGFSSGNPFYGPSAILASGDQTDTGPADHGARFDFGFGALVTGATKTFEIFYGAALTEADAFDALNAVGAEVYSFGQSVNDKNGGTAGYSTFIFGFAGVGGVVVPPSTIPVPASAALLLGGLGGLGMVGALRRRKRA